MSSTDAYAQNWAMMAAAATATPDWRPLPLPYLVSDWQDSKRNKTDGLV